jgi:hypothetical protein
MEFKCGGCGFQAPVKVEGKGGAQAHAGSRNDPSAEARVMQQADVYAMRWAEIFLELCPCPKCGWRNPVEAAGFKRRNLIVGGVSAGIALLGVVLLVCGMWVAGGIVELIGLIATIITPAMALSTWNGARRKVHFPIEHAAEQSKLGT